ncbi:ribosome-binding factor A [Pacificitalea manganoxidans]|uniref:Ribosome-binding factor A n=1 Tax=Pacificitalea manganoxidans TaxID=1411902 RepID=A0A291LV33_9RHOB|nr:30S ribosome-binding factor RbfA [Pacificitalea manganoxidans]ATI40573.1 ribosome-binding factor A [Pacificitalea manganoxidans]MDR6309557.1 ribosome-binding factor A [Pacificitalea manganoxidans]
MAKNKFSPGAGPTQRQLKVAEIIRRTLSSVLARGDVHDPDLNRISITVGEVRTSSDLKVATAYVQPLGGREPELALDALRRNRHEIRRQVARGLTLKFSPEIRFELDETFDLLDDTRRIFSQPKVQQDLVAADEDDDEAPGDTPIGTDDDR